MRRFLLCVVGTPPGFNWRTRATYDGLKNIYCRMPKNRGHTVAHALLGNMLCFIQFHTLWTCPRTIGWNGYGNQRSKTHWAAHQHIGCNAWTVLPLEVFGRLEGPNGGFRIMDVFVAWAGEIRQWQLEICLFTMYFFVACACRTRAAHCGRIAGSSATYRKLLDDSIVVQTRHCRDTFGCASWRLPQCAATSMKHRAPARHCEPKAGYCGRSRAWQDLARPKTWCLFVTSMIKYVNC